MAARAGPMHASYGTCTSRRAVEVPKGTGEGHMAQTLTERSEGTQSGKKWVYLFDEGNASMRDLLGGKGAGVAEMTRAGLPVPPGFTITTEACNSYLAEGEQFPDGLWDQ